MTSSITGHLENVDPERQRRVNIPKIRDSSVAEHASSERHGIFEIGTTNKASEGRVFLSLSILVEER
jgi:hypothetical protein